MAEKRVGNRSSEGVVAIRHPRSDFPEMGWLGKATLTFYEPNSGFGWWSETQSYRPNNKTIGYGTRQRSPRVFYQTEPQQGWLGKPNLSLYEASGGTAWLAQTATWITPRHPSRDLDRWDQDDASFDFANFSQAFDPATQDWHIDTVQTRKRKWWVGDQPQFDWLYQNVLVDPSLYTWTIDSQWKPKRKQWSSDPHPQFDWLYQNVLVDPSVFLWTIPDVRTRARNTTIPRGSDPQDTSWVFPNLPIVFDPSTQNWMVDTTRTGTRKWWSGDPHPQFDWLYQNVLVDPKVFLWTIPDVRTPDRNTAIPRGSDPQDTSWVFQNLPILFDPTLHDWGIQSDTYRRRLWRMESGIFVVADSGVTLLAMERSTFIRLFGRIFGRVN